LVVDETPDDATDDVQLKSKSAFLGRGSDPFLKADTMVSRGSCKAVVCCVGEHSTRGKYQADVSDEINQNTNLQTKLKNLANQFQLFALFAGIAIFLILCIMTFIEIGVGGSEFNPDGSKNEYMKNAADILFSKLPQHINLVVVLIVVAIPEGLPLTVGMSMAFSVMKMYKDGILVRKLDAPEKLAGCEEILCGKTATITTNDMKVAYLYLEGN